jgi:hypothetical protein
MPSRAEIARMHLDRARRYGDAKTWSARKERSHYRRAATALRFGSTQAVTLTVPIYQALKDAQQKLGILAKGGSLPSQASGAPAKNADRPTEIEFYRDIAIQEMYEECKNFGQSMLPMKVLSCMALVSADFPAELEVLLRIVYHLVEEGKKLILEILEQERKKIPIVGPLFSALPKGMEYLLLNLRGLVAISHSNVSGLLVTLLA